MSLTLKPYAEYKESGQFWLGKVPKSWEVAPAFAALSERQVKNSGLREKQVLSLSYGRVIKKHEDALHGLVPESFEGYQILEPGNIVLRFTDLQNDQRSLRVGLVKDRGIITSAYVGLTVHNRLLPEYAYYLLHAADVQKVFYGMGSGLRQSLGFADLRRMPIVIPPIEEQKWIVRYLNSTGVKTDKLIRAKRRVIELLNEQKQAIIQRAVTRGLDPNVRLKPSGIEWLPLIPETWSAKKIRQLGTISGGMTPSMENQSFWHGDIPWVTPKDMKRLEIRDSIDHVSELAVKNTSLKTIAPPAILLVVRGMILARHIPVAVATAEVTVNQDMKAIMPSSDVAAFYLAFLMQASKEALKPLIDEAGHGTKRFPTERWREVSVPVPPIVIQNEIIEYVKNAMKKVDNLISYEEKQINLLREYRTRLIADVVTGKLDVRGVALPEIEELAESDGVSDAENEDVLDEEAMAGEEELEVAE